MTKEKFGQNICDNKCSNKRRTIYKAERKAWTTHRWIGKHLTEKEIQKTDTNTWKDAYHHSEEVKHRNNDGHLPDFKNSLYPVWVRMWGKSLPRIICWKMHQNNLFRRTILRSLSGGLKCSQACRGGAGSGVRRLEAAAVRRRHSETREPGVGWQTRRQPPSSVTAAKSFPYPRRLRKRDVTLWAPRRAVVSIRPGHAR